MLMETPASSPLSVSAHLHSSAWASVCLVTRGGQRVAESLKRTGKESKGCGAPRSVERAAELRVYLSCSRMTCKFLGPLSSLHTVSHGMMRGFSELLVGRGCGPLGARTEG